MLKILDKYLLRKFIVLFIYSMIAFLAIFLVIDLVENIDKFIDAGLTRQQVLTYYLLNVPFFISTALPMSMLIATVFSIGTLAKNNELTAMKSTGVSLYRIAAPVLLLATLISVGSFFFDDQIKSQTDRKLENYKEQYIQKRPPQSRLQRSNIFLQDSENRILFIEQFNGRSLRGQHVTIQYLQSDRLLKRIDGTRILWDEEQKTWLVENYVVRTFPTPDTEKVTQRGNSTLQVDLNITPEDILKESLNPAQMNFQELSEFIDKLKMLGIAPRKWIVNLHFKIAFAFTNFVVVLFGFPLVANQRHGGIAFGAGLSIFIIFTYYAFIKVGQVMGFNGILPPFFSVWMGNLVFIGAGVLLLTRTPK
ncbi:MAG TPA: LptF/LptG family permease [bacterium]|nr:LptF/LptG family permease [bacterium]